MIMEASEIHIVPLTRQHIERAAPLIAAAFLEEPGVVAVIKRDPEKRIEILRKHFAMQVMLNLSQGVSRCAFLDGKMVGVMILTAPDRPTVTTGEMIRFLWRMMLDMSPAIVWRGFVSSLADERHRPKQPNYYLEIL